MLRTTPRPVRLDPGGIFVFESRHAPGFRMNMGEWDFDKVCFVRQGRCTLVTADANVTLAADDVTVVPAGLRHRFDDNPSAPATLVVICFRPETLASIPGQSSGYLAFRSARLGKPPLGTGQTHRQDDIRLCLRRMVFEQTTSRDGHEAAIWGHFLQLAVMLSRTAAEASSHARLAGGTEAFARSLDFLHDNFTEKIRIGNLAAMAGISYRHYTSLFRKAKGETVNTYVTKLRVNFAKKRMLETGSIAFAGLDAGFDDLSNFYRVFKKATGLTPGAYLEAQASGHPGPGPVQTYGDA